MQVCARPTSDDTANTNETSRQIVLIEFFIYGTKGIIAKIGKFAKERRTFKGKFMIYDLPNIPKSSPSAKQAWTITICPARSRNSPQPTTHVTNSNRRKFSGNNSKSSHTSKT